MSAHVPQQDPSRNPQAVGFLADFILFAIAAALFSQLQRPGSAVKAFQCIYFFSSFWNQFGPNCTTFLLAGKPEGSLSPSQSSMLHIQQLCVSHKASMRHALVPSTKVLKSRCSWPPSAAQPMASQEKYPLYTACNYNPTWPACSRGVPRRPHPQQGLGISEMLDPTYAAFLLQSCLPNPQPRCSRPLSAARPTASRPPLASWARWCRPCCTTTSATTPSSGWAAPLLKLTTQQTDLLNVGGRGCLRGSCLILHA